MITDPVALNLSRQRNAALDALAVAHAQIETLTMENQKLQAEIDGKKEPKP